MAGQGFSQSAVQAVGDRLQELLTSAEPAEREVLEALLTHAGRGGASMTDGAAVLVVPGRDGRHFVVVLDPGVLDDDLTTQSLLPGPVEG